MDHADLKEKVLFWGITGGALFIIRLVFSSYIGNEWIGSLGIATIFFFAVVILSRLDKLGWFGRIFERQMYKIIRKRVSAIVAIMLLLLLLFGGFMYFIDRGSTTYLHDTNLLHYQLYISTDASATNMTAMSGPIQSQDTRIPNYILDIDYRISTTIAAMDMQMHGWLSHMVFVIFLEQIELLGLVCYYYMTYRQKRQVDKNGK